MTVSHKRVIDAGRRASARAKAFLSGVHISSMWTLGSRSERIELIDSPVRSCEELSETFADMAFVNRRFGGIAVARHALRGISARRVLDVGCGSGDISLTLLKEARCASRVLHVTCLDANAAVLEFARMRAREEPDVTFVEANGTSLPFADGAFDVAMCNLSLHHFAQNDAVALLRELRRVSKIAPVVTDLQRNALTWAAAYAFSRFFTRNRLTRHDAPLSARRAYTRAEALALAREAGWKTPRVEPYYLIRMVVTDVSTL